MSETTGGRRGVDPKRVKPGDLMAFVYYTRVKKVEAKGASLLVEGLDGGQGEFSVAGADLISRSFSADQFGEERKVSRTRAAQELVASYNRPLTVCFVKKNGEERTLRGRL